MSSQIHATCVALPEGGVLLRGDSGAGKSDLALRLIDGGARLVADDRTDLMREGDLLIARAPTSIAGLIEARGLGILRLPPEKLAAEAAV
ncbi:MAG: HPr kinase/phosphorylase, partial [Reyranellaceae bacterium]